MRAITKLAPPLSLVTNATAWTSQYISSGGSSSPWQHAEIKAALVSETKEKCAYCEARFLAVSFGDIEHILPKSKFPELVVDWDNLTLACSRCNQHKGSKHDPQLPFVNPYRDRVEDHLLFLGPIAYSTSDRGFYTINELNLNDANRIEARDRELKSLESLLRRFEAASARYVRDELWKLIQLQAESGEYTSSIMSYLALRKQSLSASTQ